MEPNRLMSDHEGYSTLPARPYATSTPMKPSAECGTDGAVIERLIAGDEAAFSELVRTYHGSLLRLALTFVADHAAAEEVVQETWLGVLDATAC